MGTSLSVNSQVRDAVDLEPHFEKFSHRFTSETLPPINPFPFCEHCESLLETVKNSVPIVMRHSGIVRNRNTGYQQAGGSEKLPKQSLFLSNRWG